MEAAAPRHAPALDKVRAESRLAKIAQARGHRRLGRPGGPRDRGQRAPPAIEHEPANPMELREQAIPILALAG